MEQFQTELKKAWEEKEGPVVFTTVDKNNIPNSIYATCVSLFDSNTILVADNYFDKTKANIKNGSHGSILFMTKDSKAFQLKGKILYKTEGPLYDNMKTWNPEKHPGHAVAALKIEHAFSGAEKLL